MSALCYENQNYDISSDRPLQIQDLYSIVHDPYCTFYSEYGLHDVKHLLKKGPIDTASHPNFFFRDHQLYCITSNEPTPITKDSIQDIHLLQQAIPHFTIYGVTSHPKDTIQVFVNALHGKTITLDISSKESVYGVKLQIQKALAIPIDQQRITFEGKQLQDHCSIAEYNISHHSTLHLSVPLPGGMLQEPNPNQRKYDSSVNWKKTVPVHIRYPNGMSATTQLPHLLTVENIDEVTKHIVHLVVHGSKEAVEEATHVTATAATHPGTSEPKLSMPKQSTARFGFLRNCVIL